jgi:nucleoside-diphosphate-sugar epimerase
MIRGDITRLEDLRAAIQDCTAVFHCAAEKADRRKMMATNVSATRLLLDLALDSRVDFFCHMSSVGVVGKTSERIVGESAPCNPMNLYEETKLEAEQAVGRGLAGARVVILRPTNIFGTHTLLPWLKSSLSSKARLWLQGRENAHLVYVQDVAAAAAFLWQAGIKKPAETFIVSSDEESGGTHREARTLFASTIGITMHPFAFAAPLFVPYCLRLMRNGVANYGDVIYSSGKLRAKGFHFPFGMRAGLIHAAGMLRNASSHSDLAL